MSVKPPVSFLPTPGSPSISWTQWKQLFTNYLLAADLTNATPERKQALLLHCVGAEAQRIFYTLPQPVSPTSSTSTTTPSTAASTDTSDTTGTPGRDIYQQTLNLLNLHFSPTVSVVAERFRFRQRGQLPGEPIDTYIAALRELAKKCEFKSFTDEMIRDQLVEKTNSSRIRERLLIERDLPLTKAIELARHVEVALREAKELTTTSTPRTAAAVRADSRPKKTRRQAQTKDSISNASSSDSSSSRQCYRCGSRKHLANDPSCPATGKMCNFCKKVGHFAKMCKQARAARQVNHLEENQLAPTSSNVHTPSARHTTTTPIADVQVLSTEESTTNTVKPNIFCTVSVNSVPITLHVDTAISALTSTNIKVLAYNKSEIKVLGCFNAKFTYKDKECISTVYVVQSGNCLLGKDLIQGLRITIDGATLSCCANEASHSPTASAQASSTAIDTLEGETHTCSSDHITHPNTSQFSDLFTDEIGLIKGFQHKIKLKSDAQPVQQNLRRVPFAVRDKVTDELLKLESQGIIEKVPGASDWVSPIVVAWKKNGKIRICVDLRKLNENMVVEKHPIPHIEELLTELQGASCFSKLDLKSAYHQLELHEESRNLTTFVTHNGVYRYKRVCFGLASAPACFQKVMHSILAGLPGVQCYLDDVVVYGKTQAEHDQNLRRVLTKIRDSGMKLNSKCEFNASKIQLLGHVVTSEGIRPAPDLVKAIRDAPAPQSVDEIRSFLGLAGYYAKFVPNFAMRVQPIRDIQISKDPFRWTQEANEAFEQIKASITTEGEALALFDPTREVYITTDASNRGIAAIMTQLHDSEERLVMCASRKLSQCEQKYSVGEKEALACLWAVEKWHTYLWGRRFTLRTDHKALTTLLSTTGTGHRPMRISRWATRLLNYNYSVEYKPGRLNTVADALSRLPLPTSSDTNYHNYEEDTESVCLLTFSCQSVSEDKLHTAILHDNVYSKVSEYVVHGWPRDKSQLTDEFLPYSRIQNELSLHGSILFRGIVWWFRFP
ncbi:hypothetical protein HOLleu_00459 [Holothuria leucospilota]|uniref:CCHC-type domain-containing protein n=1 Tax=Holothuria leucospilota TaxID=206669 RepID=A0A9Q1CMA3_HOLLE|nr:hypothetical protein HOLleu_00459 [Holothuria leucospilota]